MKELQTPYFLIKKNELDEGLRTLKEALSIHFPGGYTIGYSYKTNALPWVINYFKNNGCYAEVVSDDEYHLAKTIGIEKSKIVYNGPIKTKETFYDALQNDCFVNIDSQREIDWLKTFPQKSEYRKLGIRVNFDLEKQCPNQSQCGDEGGRFGFCYENGELEKAINRIKEYGFCVNGLHLHCSSKTRSLDIYRAISKMACEITSAFKLSLTYIDIGGGFFGGLPQKPQFNDYCKVISEELSKGFDLRDLHIIVEPGMALIGSPVDFVSSVIDVKSTSYNRFIITDGSRTNIDPLMTKKSYFMEANLKETNRDIISKQVLCGFTCMEHDRLTVVENGMELLPGDKIIFHKVGAYTMCLSPLFIRYFPDVYVIDNDGILKVRDRWTPEDYLTGSKEI